jgi:tRNA A37 N6-isopentenylltransferase MiaA
LESLDSYFSAKEFRREAFAAVAGVLSSGYLPVVVGSVIAAAPLIWSSLQIYHVEAMDVVVRAFEY